MDVKELRVGNTVYCFGTNGGPNEWVELNISPQHIQTCFDHPELFKPISLTEDWLLKFGFIRNGSYLNWSISYFFIREEKKLTIEGEYGFCASITYRDKFAMISMLKYVHELQNLYFALTGEELTIKDI
jgi:hypothetical protein